MHFLVDGGYSESLVLFTNPGLSIHFPLKTVETCRVYWSGNWLCRLNSQR